MGKSWKWLKKLIFFFIIEVVEFLSTQSLGEQAHFLECNKKISHMHICVILQLAEKMIIRIISVTGISCFRAMVEDRGVGNFWGDKSLDYSSSEFIPHLLHISQFVINQGSIPGGSK